MNFQSAITFDLERAEDQYQNLVLRIRSAAAGLNEDRRILLQSLKPVQKEMERSLERARNHKPSKVLPKYDAFVKSFELTLTLLHQFVDDLMGQDSIAHPAIPAMPPTKNAETWQEVIEDLVDIAKESERQRMKYKRDEINNVLEFLDALDRLLDEDISNEDALKHVLEMFMKVEAMAIHNLGNVGLEKIDSPVGTPLDPMQCEVIDSEPMGGSDFIVQRQIRAGYMVDGKVFRKTAVIVGN